MVELKAENIFIEKYRPRKLDDIVGQDRITSKFKGFAKTGKIPHMLLSGPAGTGKTTSVLALLHELYGENWHRYFLEMNASDEGGVGDIRKKVKEFIDISAVEVVFKVVYLDECDALTPEAQAILRRIMEKYAYKIRFALSCNYPHKIIEPIQDRCAQFRFRPIRMEDMLVLLRDISKKEQINITPAAISTLASLSKGSMRKPLNVLEVIKSSGVTSVDETAIYEYTYWVNYEEIERLIQHIADKDLKAVESRCKDMIFEKTYSIDEILEALGEVIQSTKSLKDDIKLEAYDKLEELSYHVSRGSNPYLTLRGFCAHIMKLV